MPDPHFTTEQASRLTGLHHRLLQRWVETGFITPAAVEQGPRRRLYRWTFNDLLALRVAAAARAAGASMQALRRAVDYLRTWPETGPGHPLAGMVLALDARGELFKVLPGQNQAVALVKRRGQGIMLAVAPINRELRSAAAKEIRRAEKHPTVKGRPKGSRDKAPRRRKVVVGG